MDSETVFGRSEVHYDEFVRDSLSRRTPSTGSDKRRKLVLCRKYSRRRTCYIMLMMHIYYLRIVLIRILLDVVVQSYVFLVDSELYACILMHCFCIIAREYIASHSEGYMSKHYKILWTLWMRDLLEEYVYLHPNTKALYPFDRFYGLLVGIADISTRLVSDTVPKGIVLSTQISVLLIFLLRNGMLSVSVVLLLLLSSWYVLHLKRHNLSRNKLQCLWSTLSTSTESRIKNVEEMTEYGTVPRDRVLHLHAMRFDFILQWNPKHARDTVRHNRRVVYSGVIRALQFHGGIHVHSADNSDATDNRGNTESISRNQDAPVKEMEAKAMMCVDDESFSRTLISSEKKSPQSSSLSAQYNTLEMSELTCLDFCLKVEIASDMRQLSGMSFRKGARVLITGDSGVGKSYAMRKMIGMGVMEEQERYMKHCMRDGSDTPCDCRENPGPVDPRESCDRYDGSNVNQKTAILESTLPTSKGFFRGNCMLSEVTTFVRQGCGGLFRTDSVSVRDLFESAGDGFERTLALSCLHACLMEEWFSTCTSGNFEAGITSTLSGGERSRLYMATMLYSFIQYNRKGMRYVLVIDEGMGDLYLKLLQKAFRISGNRCIIFVISHMQSLKSSKFLWDEIIHMH